ncbi:hypothetical protein CDAR_589471 [Caerostris darwini]|uniref:Uncharacterized protein n=1 Tax=Caerostris darwini TaxID=1538125 RepID=A0AAV4T7C8_9ARAC|nr:hypothetical protein CDAR_589471 [Caerostris darwini]
MPAIVNAGLHDCGGRDRHTQWPLRLCLTGRVVSGGHLWATGRRPPRSNHAKCGRPNYLLSEEEPLNIDRFDPLRPLFDHFRILTTFDHFRILTTFDHFRIVTTFDHFRILTTFDHFRILTTFDHFRILTTFDHLRILTTKPLFSDYCIRKISVSERTPWITREKGWCLSVEGWGTLDHPLPCS